MTKGKKISTMCLHWLSYAKVNEVISFVMETVPLHLLPKYFLINLSFFICLLHISLTAKSKVTLWKQYYIVSQFFFLKRAILGLFFFIFVFSIQLTVNSFFIWTFCDDWISTADLWSWRLPPYQMSHNHCPIID